MPADPGRRPSTRSEGSSFPRRTNWAKDQALATSALITALQRPSGRTADPEYVPLLTLKALATRCQSLAAEIAAAGAALQGILDAYAPMLCDLPGVGTYVASQLLITVGKNPDRSENKAQFASLVGVAPVPEDELAPVRNVEFYSTLPWSLSDRCGHHRKYPEY